MLAMSVPNACMARDGWSGEIRLDYRYFLEPALQDQPVSSVTASVDTIYSQLANVGVDTTTLPPPTAVATTLVGIVPQNKDPSALLTLAYNKRLEKGGKFNVKGIFRYDGMDSARTHPDIRELSLNGSVDDGSDYPWNFVAGVDKVFWGTLESNHLVDIVNSTDVVENLDKSEKLGQPMFLLSKGSRFGNWDFLVLPYFRVPTASSSYGRLRPPIPFTEMPVRFDQSQEAYYPSWAIRWSKRSSIADGGIYYFKGINREPRVTQDNAAITSTNAIGLVANYDLIQRLGVDANLLVGDFIFKGEFIRQFSKYQTYTASACGFEYPFSGIFGRDWDLTTILEYSTDSRGYNSGTILQNDLFYGLRLSLNDIQSTQFKVGLLVDQEDWSKSLHFDASRRITDSMLLKLESQYFWYIDPNNALYPVSQDTYVQLSLTYYF